MSESLQERMARIAAERERIAAEENTLRGEAQAELDRIILEIESLEERKEQLEAFLGLEDNARAEHGQIRDLCTSALSRNSGGLTSGQVKDIIERENPALRLSSVPATLSRMVSQGRLRRDETGRYFLA